MMAYLSANQVIRIVEAAITDRSVLNVRYQHTTDNEIVVHRIAPFDIGSTNPDIRIRNRNKNNVYAYSYTHVDKKKNQPDPRVCPFNIDRFITINPSGETFDEKELARINLEATGFDYRGYRFALLPNRDWF